MFKFEAPKPTKSGNNPVIIWKELKRTWRKYKLAKLKSDLAEMKQYASVIVKLQDDLGITQAKFPELEIKELKIS